MYHNDPGRGKPVEELLPRTRSQESLAPKRFHTAVTFLCRVLPKMRGYPTGMLGETLSLAPRSDDVETTRKFASAMKLLLQLTDPKITDLFVGMTETWASKQIFSFPGGFPRFQLIPPKQTPDPRHFSLQLSSALHPGQRCKLQLKRQVLGSGCFAIWLNEEIAKVTPHLVVWIGGKHGTSTDNIKLPSR